MDDDVLDFMGTSSAQPTNRYKDAIAQMNIDTPKIHLSVFSSMSAALVVLVPRLKAE